MYTLKTIPAKIIRQLLYWILLLVPVSFVIGSIVALFLWLLDIATATRWQHLWLIWLLPVAGICIYFIYKVWGKNAEKGNNLIMDEIHQPGGGIPARMAPLVLLTTIITHLFGGSAGREGTAVQIGGSTASLFAKWYRLPLQERRILLTSGMAAGFGAVFGTPVAGAIFALEVLTIGRIKYDALLPCLTASVLANITCEAYGIHHTAYAILLQPSYQVSVKWLQGLSFDFLLLGKIIIASIAFGLAGSLFAKLTHILKNMWNKIIKQQWLVPVIGGVLVIGISYGLGTFDYMGLGVTNPDSRNSIVAAFTINGVDTWSWLWKLLLTAITLSAGFKGGEVTPLFFIGATLGNIIAVQLGAPVNLLAGLGFIAVFAAATNTPIACIIMGVELFGAENMVYFAVACFTAYYCSGHSGIYASQRIVIDKFHNRMEKE